MSTMTRREATNILGRALVGPEGLLSDVGLRGRLAFRVVQDIELVGAGRWLCVGATASPVAIGDRGGERRIAGFHTLMLHQSPRGELSASVVALTVKDPLATHLVAHATESLRTDGVLRLQFDASAKDLGAWTAAPGELDRSAGADVASIVKAGCERWLAGRGSFGVVDGFLDQVNGQVLRITGTGLRRQDRRVEFVPGGGGLERRFSEVLNGVMTPGRLRSLGPDVQGGPFGAWVIANSGRRWEQSIDLQAGAVEKGPAGAISMLRPESLTPGAGPGLDPIGA